MTYAIKKLRGKEGSVAIYDTASVAAEHRDWVVGPFVKTDTGESLTSRFEVKTGMVKKGEGRTEWTESYSGQSWMMILEGLCETIFLIDGKEEVVELSPGEAILWDNTIPHKNNILEDTTYIMVRVK